MMIIHSNKTRSKSGGIPKSSQTQGAGPAQSQQSRASDSRQEYQDWLEVKEVIKEYERDEATEQGNLFRSLISFILFDHFFDLQPIPPPNRNISLSLLLLTAVRANFIASR